jgi:group I intron endonuclease
MKRIGYIYKTTNLINSKVYIGQHQRDEFDKKYYGTGKIILRALKKYGKENFKVEIIKWYSSLDKLNEAEIEFIRAFDSRNPMIGYNVSFGGNQVMKGLHHSEETKKKISEAGKGKIISDECKNKISIANKGRKFPKSFGQKISKSKKGKPGHKTSEETKIKLHKANKGQIIPEWQKQLISIAQTGRIKTKEEKLKIGNSLKGNKYRLGKPHTEEAKKRISEACKGIKKSEETKAKMKIVQARRNELRLLSKKESA